MEIFLVRHGETEIGPDHLYPEDAALTDLGIRQAEAACEALADVGITHVVTSNLTRAIQSARPLVESSGLTPVALSGLDEVRIGEFRSAPIEEIVHRLYKTKPYSDFSQFYGENAADFAERVMYTLSRGVVDAIGDPDARVAVFAHGGTISVIIDQAQGLRFRPGLPTDIPNGSICKIRVDGEALALANGPNANHLEEVGVTQMFRADRYDEDQSTAADSGS